MEGLIVPSVSRPPLTISPKRNIPSEFSLKFIRPKISLNKPHEAATTTRELRVSDAHLHYLCRNGRLSEAIAALDSIAHCGSKVRPKTFTRLLQSCIDSNSIHLGRELHKRVHLLSKDDAFVETKLVSMYAKCGRLGEARKVFDEMREKNLYSWSAMIGACSREHRWREVVDLFFLMMKDDILPDEFLFPKILQACGNCGDVEAGKLIHSIVIRCGMNCEIRVNNSILAVYAKCGSLSSVRRFFENMEEKDLVSWNCLVTAYCQNGEIGEAHQLLNLMRAKGIEPGLVTWNILITSYNQFGNCELAMEMVKEMESFGITPDVVTWTSMISGFDQNNRASQALELFGEVFLAGVEPNEITLMSSISACASLKSLRKGKELHSIAVKKQFAQGVLAGNSLIDMYSKCWKLEDARNVFDMVLEKDVYTWNSMIGGYCQAGYCGKAHDLFMKMQGSITEPNVITWNAMISGYIQNGDEDRALDLFQRMEKGGMVKRDTASWNSLIAGYLQNGQKDKAFRIFRQMQSHNVIPNAVTVLSVLPACETLVATKKVKEIHGCVLRRNLWTDLSVANSLIDTYAKSGNIAYSRTIFDRMTSKDFITWNAMIAGYVLHGCANAGLAVFNHMKKLSLEPNRSTFVSIIAACSLAGRIDEGKQAFSSMIQDCYILPCSEHYVAMVDLFGRSGRLKEAIEFIEDMAVEPDFSIWAALLTASRINKNIRLAVDAGERLLEMEPGNLSIKQCVLQAYALSGISDDSLKLRKLGRGNENKQFHGLSWIEVGNMVHTFVPGDQSKPNSEILHSWVKNTSFKMRGSDYHGLCIEEEEREETGGIHSEKLAIAFALTGSQPSQSIRVVKSIRMCGDCHKMAKFISGTYSCEIYLKDSKCLHHFKCGHCSCGDYW